MLSYKSLKIYCQTRTGGGLLYRAQSAARTSWRILIWQLLKSQQVPGGERTRMTQSADIMGYFLNGFITNIMSIKYLKRCCFKWGENQATFICCISFSEQEPPVRVTTVVCVHEPGGGATLHFHKPIFTREVWSIIIPLKQEVTLDVYTGNEIDKLIEFWQLGCLSEWLKLSVSVCKFVDWLGLSCSELRHT